MEYQKATFTQRLTARIIDLVIIGSVEAFLASLFISKNPLPPNAEIIILITIPVTYFLSFTAFSGRTIGKKILKLKVVGNNGERPKLMKIIIRELTGLILSTLPFTIGHIWMLWDKEGKTWQDKLSNTLVISASS